MVEVELAWEQAKTGYNAIGAITRPSKAEHIENLKPEKWEDPNYWVKWKSESISLDKDEKMKYIFDNLVYHEWSKEWITQYEFTMQEETVNYTERGKSCRKPCKTRQVKVRFSSPDGSNEIIKYVYLNKETWEYIGIKEDIIGTTNKWIEHFPWTVRWNTEDDENFREQYRFIHYQNIQNTYLLNRITGRKMHFDPEKDKIILVDKETQKEFTGPKQDLYSKKIEGYDFSNYELKVVPIKN